MLIRFVCLLFWASRLTSGDLPVHCVHSDIVGHWVIHVGFIRHGDDLDTEDFRCGYNAPDRPDAHYHLTPGGDQLFGSHAHLTKDFHHEFDIHVVFEGWNTFVYELKDISGSNLADETFISFGTDEDELYEGHFTMTYNQGYFFSVKNKYSQTLQFFANPKYNLPSPSNAWDKGLKTLKSYSTCTMTMLGHLTVLDTAKPHHFPVDQLCWWGEKKEKLPETIKYHPKLQSIFNRLENRFNYTAQNPPSSADRPRRAIVVGLASELASSSYQSLMMWSSIICLLLGGWSLSREPLAKTSKTKTSFVCLASLAVLITLLWGHLPSFTSVRSLVRGPPPPAPVHIPDYLQDLVKISEYISEMPGFSISEGDRNVRKAQTEISEEMGIPMHDLRLKHLSSLFPSKKADFSSREAYLNMCTPEVGWDKASEDQWSRCAQEPFRKDNCAQRSGCVFKRVRLQGEDWDNLEKLPAFDWRYVTIVDQGEEHTNFVPPVLKQGSNCGSCYAEGFVTSVTSRLMIRYPHLHKEWNRGIDNKISVDEILDCSYLNQGCRGGLPFLVAIEWFQANFHSETEYKILKQTGKNCLRPGDEDYFFEQALYDTKSFRVENWHYIGGTVGSCGYGHICDEALRHELFNFGPLSIAVDADGGLWNYSGGILWDEDHNGQLQEDAPKDCGSPGMCFEWQEEHHALGLTGWGEDVSAGRSCQAKLGTDPNCSRHTDKASCVGDCEWKGKRFWMMKNSWGSRWGIEGYIHLGPRGHSPLHTEFNNVGVNPVYTREILDKEGDKTVDLDEERGEKENK